MPPGDDSAVGEHPQIYDGPRYWCDDAGTREHVAGGSEPFAKRRHPCFDLAQFGHHFAQMCVAELTHGKPSLYDTLLDARGKCPVAGALTGKRRDVDF